MAAAMPRRPCGQLVTVAELWQQSPKYVYRYDHGVDQSQPSDQPWRVLLGALEQNERADVDLVERGRVMLRDSTGVIPCRLLQWSSTWLDRPLLITRWAYVPATLPGAASWLTSLEIMEVAPLPLGISPATVRERLLTGRLDLAPIEPLVVSRDVPLSEAQLQHTTSILDAQKWLADQYSASDNGAISILGKVTMKSVVHRQPGEPSWFFVRLNGIRHNGRRDDNEICVLFRGDTLARWHSDLRVMDLVWMGDLHARHLLLENRDMSCGQPVLCFTKHSTMQLVSPSTVQALIVDGRISVDRRDTSASRAGTLVNSTYMRAIPSASYRGIITRVVDVTLGVFELGSSSSSSSSSGFKSAMGSNNKLQRILLYRTHDPSYRPSDAFRKGHCITVSGAHLAIRGAMDPEKGTCIFAACSATSIELEDFGDDPVPPTLQVQVELLDFFYWCDRQQWNFYVADHLLRLASTIQLKFPGAFDTAALLRAPEASELGCHASNGKNATKNIETGFIWRLLARLTSSSELQKLWPEVGAGQRARDFVSEFIEHTATECPATAKLLSFPSLPAMSHVAQKLAAFCAKQQLHQSERERYHWRRLSRRELKLDNIVLVGVLHGDSSGQLELRDDTGHISLLAVDASNNTSQQAVHAYHLGHIWAITNYDLALEYHSVPSRPDNACMPRIYIRFSWQDAACVCKGSDSLSTEPAQEDTEGMAKITADGVNAYVLVEHVHSVQQLTTSSNPEYVAYVEALLLHMQSSSIEGGQPLLQDAAPPNVDRCNIRLTSLGGIRWLPALRPGRIYLLRNVKASNEPLLRKRQGGTEKPTLRIDATERTVVESVELCEDSEAGAGMNAAFKGASDVDLHRWRLQFHALLERKDAPNLTDLWHQLVGPRKMAPDAAFCKRLHTAGRKLALLAPMSIEQLLLLQDVPSAGGNKRQTASTEHGAAVRGTGRMLGGGFFEQLVDFTGIIQQRFVRSSHTLPGHVRAVDAQPSSLVIRMSDSLADTVQRIDLLIDLDSNSQLPRGLARGERITVRRAALKQGRSGAMVYLALACTEITLNTDQTQVDVADDAHTKRPGLCQPVPLCQLLRTPNQPLAQQKRVWVVAELVRISNASVWWSCAECGERLCDNRCQTGCQLADEDAALFEGDAFCFVNDGTTEAQLKLNDPELILKLLQVGQPVAEQLRRHAMSEGMLTYTCKQQLDATYGAKASGLPETIGWQDTGADVRSSNLYVTTAHAAANGRQDQGVSDGQRLFHHCCQNARRADGRIAMLCEVQATRSAGKHQVRLGSKDPLHGTYHQQCARVGNRQMHTLMWPKITLRGLHLEYVSASTAARRILGQLMAS
ncbi:hypothetical protein THASP1DRAFT_28760 [Thamnocephalis sphaerospora]|uniref:CST complex subunit CTC1 n=1 Tax=Thamnocephalis sphaerospora TaxID=78915 RepID=A0A4P9XTF3_9FUNG|nr:hypothetical protein THASP1DRAFT_28760 [Thamnocephalis sphaerospora]|eukprot:RKP09448.1 hypothetical protein THASP1DRAFT_28760 [Thamnocephalis sphaerospora]